MYPTSSIPLRPARPAICVYSCGNKHLYPFCVYFLREVNTTLLVGIFIPTANVSVANNRRMYFFLNNNSIISLKIGVTPE